MDPNAALAALRAALTKARAAAEGDSNDAEIEAWQEVGDYIEEMDQWLTRGGFAPNEWTVPTPDASGPISVVMLRDDWADNPDLTETEVALLGALSDETLQEALDTAFRAVEDHWYSILDNVRGDATRALLSKES
jgi:hypothetical protein